METFLRFVLSQFSCQSYWICSFQQTSQVLYNIKEGISSDQIIFHFFHISWWSQGRADMDTDRYTVMDADNIFTSGMKLWKWWKSCFASKNGLNCINRVAHFYSELHAIITTLWISITTAVEAFDLKVYQKESVLKCPKITFIDILNHYHYAFNKIFSFKWF